MPFDPQTDLARIPAEPGVYLMRNAAGEIFYVGKAADLRARLRQYFGATSDTRLFVSLLDRILDDIEVVITHTAKEALILENELIKRYQPRFNVELKDDKAFLHLRIDESKRWPRIDVVRRPRRDGARYFGPYHSASKIRETLKLVERHFRIRNCDELTFRNRSRPCLQHQIGRCPAPCVLPVDNDEYRQSVAEVGLFLQGRHTELLADLRARMADDAEALRFERAAQRRDQIRAIEGSLEPQQVAEVGRSRAIDRDVFGLHREGSLLEVALLLVRRGKLVGSRSFGFEDQEVPDAEVLSTFLNLYYHGGAEVPEEVLVPVEPNEAAAVEERLEDMRGRKVTLRVPRRGTGRKLLELAARNAEQAFVQGRRNDSVRNQALVKLKRRLGLANLPTRIECYDISIFQGGSPVASQVVFEGGVPLRSAYRHYKIRGVEGTDDFAMMREVLERRLKRGLAEGDLPDLLVVDGGKGQLGVVVALAGDMGIEGVDLAGLAKSRLEEGPRDDEAGLRRSPERVFRPGRKDPIVLRPHTDELFLMAQIRDEAHRFAITFHRKLRGKRSLGSALNGIPGVGPARRRALMQAFGSVRKLRDASEEALATVPGIGPALAREIREALGVP
jgi:excinuclease ABC subunit C